ncbi:MAG: DUF3667 domain-containing protein [Planctomycetota bacterium]
MSEPKAPTKSTRDCAECGRKMVGYRFCPECGQDVNIGPLKLSVILSAFFSMLTGLEFPLLRTTVDLLWRPGFVADAWIRGKRRTYASPMKFCLITGVLITLTLRLVDAPTQVLAEDLSAFERGMVVAVTEYFAFFAMALLIPLALVMGLTSWLLKAYRTPIEWYALGLYIIGISVILQLLFGVVQSFAPMLPPVAGSFPILLYVYGAWGFAANGQRARSALACLLSFVALIGASLLMQMILSATFKS